MTENWDWALHTANMSSAGPGEPPGGWLMTERGVDSTSVEMTVHHLDVLLLGKSGGPFTKPDHGNVRCIFF